MVTQTTRICSEADCDRPHHGRGFCAKHYFRQYTPGLGRVYPERGSCQIAGCAKPHKAHGWCGTHHARFLRTGSPTGNIARRRRPTCSMPSCDSPHVARGYCGAHWKRWKLNGDPSVTRGDGRWLGDDVGYLGMHTRLRKARGAASEHPCADCGSEAAEWSYDHSDPDEKTETIGNRVLKFSVDIDHYQARCRSCHRLFDSRAEA